MIRSTLTAAAAALAPAAALAHGGPEGHGHPHGLEILALGAIAVAAIWAVRRARR
jgi:MYXO-CTERM domain-containing protein